MARLGFGDCTDGGLLCKTGRVCSNMLTRELVGGIGVSSVGLSRPACSARATATGSALVSSLLLLVAIFCCLESILANTFPTLPGGGRTSRSFASLSDMVGAAEGCGMGFMGLYLAAASFAAMFEGEGTGSRRLSTDTARLLELFDLPSTTCQSGARLASLSSRTQRLHGRGIRSSRTPRAPARPVPAQGRLQP